jgi:hypothetical protein
MSASTVVREADGVGPAVAALWWRYAAHAAALMLLVAGAEGQVVGRAGRGVGHLFQDLTGSAAVLACVGSPARLPAPRLNPRTAAFLICPANDVVCGGSWCLGWAFTRSGRLTCPRRDPRQR